MMPPLPSTFSLQAIPIQSALSEGRTEDAKTLIVEILLAGSADKVVQRLAAEIIKPPKRGRGRKKTNARYWLDIGEQFHWLRDEGMKYEEALLQLAAKFGVSETHVRNAVREYDSATNAHEQACRE